MKILFLDIDGVLNSHAYFEKIKERLTRGYSSEESSGEQYASAMMDPEAIACLNQIVAATKAVVVISSTWRLAHPLVHIERMLRFRGFEGHVIGATLEARHGFRTPAFEKFAQENPEHPDSLRGRCRGNEIQAWLDAVPSAVSSFVILDDDADMAHLLPRLVRTSHQTGLVASDADRAIEILNDPGPT